jgi:hypothetical protein
MDQVQIDKEKLQVATETSLSQTWEELAEHYKGNDDLLSSTFPLMRMEEPMSIHKKRYVGKDGKYYYYTNWPWTMLMTAPTSSLKLNEDGISRT